MVVTGYRRYLPADDYERLAAVVDKPFDVADLTRVLQTLVGTAGEVAAGR